MEPSQNVYDRQNTLLALNMAVVAVKTIVSSEDRIVLEQQYRTIIDRLKFGNIESDDELVSFHEDLLRGITGSLLAQDERRRFEQVYDREQKRAVFTALKGALTALSLPGELPWLALGKTLMTGATAFFGYRTVKDRLSEELSDELWRLEREKVRGIDALQRSLLQTTWRILRKYGFSDDERVTQENLEELEKAIQQPDPVRARRMFADLSGKFKAYPPFLFHYGESALQSGDLQTAEDCFARFDKTNRDVLSKDPYRIQIAKYRLMMSNNPTCGYVRSQLAIVAEDDAQWLNNLYRGVLLFAIGDKDEGIRAVEHNIDFDYEKEISSLVLKAMTQGTQHLWAALAYAFYDGKGVEADKAAAYKYACLARLYGEKSVDKLIENIEGTSGWFGFGKKAELDLATIQSIREEAQLLYVQYAKQRNAADDEKAEVEQELHEQLEREHKTQEEAEEEARKLEAQSEQDRKRAEAIKRGASGGSLVVGEVGSTVTFGRYPQHNGGVSEPIEWLVVAKESNKALLISKYGLDAKRYHKDWGEVTWEQCSLRAWLNGEFLNQAFNVGELSKIVQAQNRNLENARYGTSGGATTNDWAFCLSIVEAKYYLKNKSTRKCCPTNYARANNEAMDNNIFCMWWLRSPGGFGGLAAVVDCDGAVSDCGLLNDVCIGVRPALWVSTL